MADSELKLITSLLNTNRELRERVAVLEAQLKFNSARYSEGGSGEYVNSPESYNRFEGKP